MFRPCVWHSNLTVEAAGSMGSMGGPCRRWFEAAHCQLQKFHLVGLTLIFTCWILRSTGATNRICKNVAACVDSSHSHRIQLSWAHALAIHVSLLLVLAHLYQ